MRVFVASLIALLLGSTSAQNENAASGGMASRCSGIKAPLMAKVSDVQKELYSAMELLKAELTAMRKTQEAGLLEIKNSLLVQAMEAKKTTGKAVPGAVAKELRKIREEQAAATAKLRREVLSELGKMERRLRSQPSTGCAKIEPLLRRVTAAMCTRATAAVRNDVNRLTQAHARLEKTVTSGLRQHERRLNAFDEKRQAAMKSFLRVLGYQRSTNSSSDKALSELADCAAKMKDGSAKMQLVNIAPGKKTKQSSTLGQGIPNRAVDGNTNGYYPSKSCTHTKNGGRSWWTVDLGSVYPIHSVVLWNRVDCCADRLRGFEVWLSTESGYISRRSRSSQTQCDGQVGPWSSVNPKNTVSCGKTLARYVTVSTTSGKHLTLCEVEVQVPLFAGRVNKTSLQLVNVARGEKTRQSSTSGQGIPNRAVDGNTNGYYPSKSCTHTKNGGRNWWTVDLGIAYPINSVVLWNRVDCCADRLRGFKVWLSTESGYVSRGSRSSQTQCGGQVGLWSSVNPKITMNCGNKLAQYVTISTTNRKPLTLCEVQVYVETLYVSPFKVENEFVPITVRDMDIGRSGKAIGRYSWKTCGVQCLLKGLSCHGFHASTTNQCTLFTKATETWKEKLLAKDVKIWIRPNGGRNPNCTASQFPDVRGRSRYRVERRKMSWREAAKNCRSRGAKLVQLSSEQEWSFVRRIMQRAKAHSYYHIGLFQQTKFFEPNGDWKWHSSYDQISLWNRWKKRQPDNTLGEEDYGMMNSATGLFSDIPNRNRYPSVCECFVA